MGLQFALLDVSLCNARSHASASRVAIRRLVLGTVSAFVLTEGAAARRKGNATMDLFYLGLTAVFFALSWALVVACARLS